MDLIIPAAILQQGLRGCNVKCQNVYFVKQLVGEAEGSGNNE